MIHRYWLTSFMINFLNFEINGIKSKKQKVEKLNRKSENVEVVGSDQFVLRIKYFLSWFITIVKFSKLFTAKSSVNKK